jgi:hypothetical protein
MVVHVSGLVGVRLRALQGCIVVAVVGGGVGLVVVDFFPSDVCLAILMSDYWLL